MASAESCRRFVRYALSIGAMELIPEGRSLKSGRLSPYFFNAGRFGTGEAMCELARAYASRIATLPGPYVLFGPAYKGIPLAVATSIALWIYHGINAGWASNRKEEKDHGEGGTALGQELFGKRVVIVDDVSTTGDTAEKAVSFVRSSSADVVGFAIAFDRQERGSGSCSAVQEFKEKLGIPVLAAANLQDFIEVLEHSDPGILPKVISYQAKYGV